MTDPVAVDAGVVARLREYLVIDLYKGQRDTGRKVVRMLKERGEAADIIERLLSERQSAAADMRERAVANLRKWLDRNHASLHAGEFSAQEWRTLRSVLGVLILETSALPLETDR